MPNNKVAKLPTKVEKPFWKQGFHKIPEVLSISDIAEYLRVPEATVESLRSFGMGGGIVEHADGSYSAMKFSDIQDALEIYHRLNKEHRVAFEERLRKSQKDAANMIGFFQERLKRDLV